MQSGFSLAMDHDLSNSFSLQVFSRQLKTTYFDQFFFLFKVKVKYNISSMRPLGATGHCSFTPQGKGHTDTTKCNNNNNNLKH